MKITKHEPDTLLINVPQGFLYGLGFNKVVEADMDKQVLSEDMTKLLESLDLSLEEMDKNELVVSKLKEHIEIEPILRLQVYYATAVMPHKNYRIAKKYLQTKGVTMHGFDVLVDIGLNESGMLTYTLDELEYDKLCKHTYGMTLLQKAVDNEYLIQ